MMWDITVKSGGMLEEPYLAIGPADWSKLDGTGGRWHARASLARARETVLTPNSHVHHRVVMDT